MNPLKSMNEPRTLSHEHSITERVAAVEVSSATRFFTALRPVVGQQADDVNKSLIRIRARPIRWGLPALVGLWLVIGISDRTWAATRVVVWGNPDFESAFQAPPDLTNAVAVAALNLGALALKADGTIVEFGPNAPDQAAPPPGLSNVVAISSGDFAMGALKRDGTVVAWGDTDQSLV